MYKTNSSCHNRNAILVAGIHVLRGVVHFFQELMWWVCPPRADDCCHWMLVVGDCGVFRMVGVQLGCPSWSLRIGLGTAGWGTGGEEIVISRFAARSPFLWSHNFSRRRSWSIVTVGSEGLTGTYLLKNFLFRNVTLHDPSTFTTY
jgi:hypothetical protein